MCVCTLRREREDELDCYFMQCPCTHNETIISLQHLYQLIVIFSAPAIHIIWTEPLPLAISHPARSISAHQRPFLDTTHVHARTHTHVLWDANGFYTWVLHSLFIYLNLSDVPVPVRAVQLAVYHKKKSFEDIFFNWTRGITLKWLWNAQNQKFIRGIFNIGVAVSAQRGQLLVVVEVIIIYIHCPAHFVFNP